jgi:phosphate-selective porin O/P
MNRQARLMAAILAGGLAFGAASALAQTSDSSTNSEITDLKQEISALQTKVDKLETEEEQKQAAETKQDVLEDAEKEDELTNLGSGYDPNVGFVIRSGDGAFSFHPGVLFDFRDMTSTRQRVPQGDVDLPAVTGSDTQSGFDATRMRLTFDGNYTKNFNYFIQFQDDQGSTFNLYDAYGVLHLGSSPFSVKFGQFKDPVYHERMLSEVNLLAVDRSLLESFFGGGNTSRVQGVSLMYNEDRIRAQLAVHDGYNSINTKFFDSASTSVSPLASTLDNVAPNFGVSGRFEYMLIGDRTKDFNPYSEYDGGFTALGDKEDILVLGSGFDYTQAGANSGFYHTVDAQFDDTSGLSLYAAYLGSYRHFPDAIAPASTPATGLAPVFNYGVTTPGNFYDNGLLAQAGYLVTPDIEPFIRYDYTYLASGSVRLPAAGGKKAGAEIDRDDVQEFTAGANYYIYKQHLKFTIDAVYLPTGTPVDQDALGILADNGHSEFVLRLQFQVAI